MAFHPYLNFGGSCRDAFTRYQEVFGGELVLMKASDMPSDTPPPAGSDDLIMHAALTFDGHLLMASDGDPSSFGPVQGMYVNYTTPEVDEAKRVYEALSEGGTIEMPMEATFWSPAFGVLRDRFGTPWMVSADGPEQS